MFTEIVVAAMHGDSVRIRDLHAIGHSVDAVDRQGWMPIHWAAGSGSFEGVRGLIECGVEQDSKTAEGLTAAQIAGKHGHDELARWLSHPQPLAINPSVVRRRSAALA